MIIKPERITPELMEMCKPSLGSKWHWAMNINAVLEDGYCSECNLVPVGCVREGCGECKGHEDEKGYLATLRAKAKVYDDAMSIPLSDGTRLKVGEAFAVKDEYPFFSDGLENYNATLEWDDESKQLFYDIYKVSDRVSGRACGGTVDDIEWENVVRRKVRVCKEVKE